VIWVPAPNLDRASRLGSHSQTVQPEGGGWPRYTVAVYMPTYGTNEVAVYEHRHETHQSRIGAWPASLAWVVLDVLQSVGQEADFLSVFGDEAAVRGQEGLPVDRVQHVLNAVDLALRQGLVLGDYWIVAADVRDRVLIRQPRWSEMTYRGIVVSGDLIRLSAYEREFREQWLIRRYAQSAITVAIIETVRELRLRLLG